MNESFTTFSTAQRMARMHWESGYELGFKKGKEKTYAEIEQNIREIFAQVLFEKPSQRQIIERMVFHFERRIGMNVAPDINASEQVA